MLTPTSTLCSVSREALASGSLEPALLLRRSTSVGKLFPTSPLAGGEVYKKPILSLNSAAGLRAMSALQQPF